MTTHQQHRITIIDKTRHGDGYTYGVHCRCGWSTGTEPTENDALEQHRRHAITARRAHPPAPPTPPVGDSLGDDPRTPRAPSSRTDTAGREGAENRSHLSAADVAGLFDVPREVLSGGLSDLRVCIDSAAALVRGALLFDTPVVPVAEVLEAAMDELRGALRLVDEIAHSPAVEPSPPYRGLGNGIEMVATLQLQPEDVLVVRVPTSVPSSMLADLAHSVRAQVRSELGNVGVLVLAEGVSIDSVVRRDDDHGFDGISSGLGFPPEHRSSCRCGWESMGFGTAAGARAAYDQHCTAEHGGSAPLSDAQRAAGYDDRPVVTYRTTDVAP